MARRAQHAAVIARAKTRGEWTSLYEAYRYQEFGDLLPLLDHERQADFFDPEPIGLHEGGGPYNLPSSAVDREDTCRSIASLLHLHAQMRRRGIA